ncbi:MAG: HAD-IA family hydrolase [Planctomycetes bacterium]|nr:HAD-IA family hydrolase [Planctomycetota bacterium]
MISSAFDLIVFDLDGTLADSLRDLTESINAALARLGLGPLHVEQVRLHVGDGVRRLVERSLGDSGDAALQEKAQELFLAHYRRHCTEHTRLYPGVRGALESLPRVKKAVLTNKPEAMTREILAALGIEAHFRHLVGGDGPFPRKPDAAGLRHLMREAGVPPERTLMVGDGAVDVLTARAAGVRSAGVTYGFRPDQFREHPPDHVLSSLLDLVET